MIWVPEAQIDRSRYPDHGKHHCSGGRGAAPGLRRGSPVTRVTARTMTEVMDGPKTTFQCAFRPIRTRRHRQRTAHWSDQPRRPHTPPARPRRSAVPAQRNPGAVPSASFSSTPRTGAKRTTSYSLASPIWAPATEIKETAPSPVDAWTEPAVAAARVTGWPWLPRRRGHSADFRRRRTTKGNPHARPVLSSVLYHRSEY